MMTDCVIMSIEKSAMEVRGPVHSQAERGLAGTLSAVPLTKQRHSSKLPH
jgi:hypothetical protein